uniref:Uncharacterized protein n=1 Tax=Timema monikensis TaxID=170555 RepID=A0A7R9HJN5_9NEOP|nr:unnamed protein product [Timema monikensis]
MYSSDEDLVVGYMYLDLKRARCNKVELAQDRGFNEVDWIKLSQDRDRGVIVVIFRLDSVATKPFTWLEKRIIEENMINISSYFPGNKSQMPGIIKEKLNLGQLFGHYKSTPSCGLDSNLSVTGKPYQTNLTFSPIADRCVSPRRMELDEVSGTGLTPLLSRLIEQRFSKWAPRDFRTFAGLDISRYVVGLVWRDTRSRVGTYISEGTTSSCHPSRPVMNERDAVTDKFGGRA